MAVLADILTRALPVAHPSTQMQLMCACESAKVPYCGAIAVPGGALVAVCATCQSKVTVSAPTTEEVTRAFAQHARVCRVHGATGKSLFEAEFAEQVRTPFDMHFKWSHSARDPSRVVVACIGGCQNTAFSSLSPDLMKTLRKHVVSRHTHLLRAHRSTESNVPSSPIILSSPEAMSHAHSVEFCW